MAGNWCDTTWQQDIHSIRLCGGFFFAYTGGIWWHRIKGNQSIEHIQNLFENTREFPYLSNWNRPCRWIEVLFSEMTHYHNHMETLLVAANPQVSNQIISNFMMFAIQKERITIVKKEGHDLNFSTAILHFISVVPNASKWRYILFPFVSSSKVEFIFWICHILNLMTTILLD